MNVTTRPLDVDERIRAHEMLDRSMLHEHEKGVWWTAFAVAVTLHVVVLLIQFPEWRMPPPAVEATPYLIVTKYIPPPPQIERRQVPRSRIVRKVPVPDPTPEEPEPIREPQPIALPDPIPDDVELLIGVPEAPPPPPPDEGPRMAGIGDVSNPRLIPETKVRPVYPELARQARVEGQVWLQAVIRRDGSVGALEVLRCDRPGLGFEEAAIEAVQRWRYEPARSGGRPVDAYFTVIVDFVLKKGVG